MQIDYFELLISLILASFGGLVKRMTDLEKKPEKNASASYFMFGTVISMFVGIVVYILCKYFSVSPLLTAGLTALSGYVGTPALDMLSNIAQQRLKRI